MTGRRSFCRSVYLFKLFYAVCNGFIRNTSGGYFNITRVLDFSRLSIAFNFSFNGGFILNGGFMFLFAGIFVQYIVKRVIFGIFINLQL